LTLADEQQHRPVSRAHSFRLPVPTALFTPLTKCVSSTDVAIEQQTNSSIDIEQRTLSLAEHLSVVHQRINANVNEQVKNVHSIVQTLLKRVRLERCLQHLFTYDMTDSTTDTLPSFVIDLMKTNGRYRINRCDHI
jgi:hypothetical protein